MRPRLPSADQEPTADPSATRPSLREMPTRLAPPAGGRVGEGGRRLRWTLPIILAASLIAAPAVAQESENVDRTAVRWHSRATGGVRKPQFISARLLAFEARLEALTEELPEGSAPYADKHVRAAIQRHIAETMLATLPVDPKPKPKEVALYAEAARELLFQRIGEEGEAKIDAARKAEGITREELDAILRRRARASWYLDKMVAPMLRPSELDLRQVHARGETPYTERPFEDVREEVRQWFISTRLSAALDRYFRNVRARVSITLITRPT